MARKSFWVSGLVACFVATLAVADAAMTAPHVRIAETKQLPTPLPYPYDEMANADAAVDAAFARAKTNGKRVLVDLGGNWCPDCRILAGVMALPEVKPFLDEQKWSQKVYFEDGLSNLLQVSSIPTTIIFGKKGEVVSRMPGFLPDRFVDMLSERIDEALGRQPQLPKTKGAISQ